MYRIRMGPSNVELLLRTDLESNDHWELEDRSGDITFKGQLLGFASSQRFQHTHGTTPVDGAPGQALLDAYQGRTRCAACRWSEIYIFKVTEGDGPATGRYCVYTLGPSTVKGETTRGRIRWASSGYEVVELCTVRRGDRGAPWLPAAHSKALAMAADIDERVENAYVNRAVA